MQGMMKKMGISQEELPVRRVLFEMDEHTLVIEDPSVIQIKMQGQTSYQVSGEAREEGAEVYSAEDVTMVMDQTGKELAAVKEALDETGGDIAEAIMKLKS